MKSWDCFDTLVFRIYKHPHTVFEEVGRRLGIKNFIKQRIKAEKHSNGSYIDIYKNLPSIDPAIEFQVELEHLSGIPENINRVSDGDLIVSDMYLSESQIREILISCGLQKNVKIFVTPDGKHKGYIWDRLPKIDLHIGDNYVSDVESPKKHGINSEHYTDHNFNTIEEEVALTDYQLACWMRYVRLKCPFAGYEKSYWLDQSNYNLPILALASLELPNKEIVFNYRDSIYWHKLYEAITGKKSESIITSRKCLYNPSSEFKKYVIEKTTNKVIADLQGTGDSLNSFFGRPFEAIYICGKAPWSIAGHISDSIERHNCSSLKHLEGWGEQGPIYGECEHDPCIIKIQSLAMETAIASSKYFKIKKNKELMISLLWKMRKNFTHKNVNWESYHE